MLLFFSSFSLAFAGDICSEMDCSLLQHISSFSQEEANERWNMMPRQTRANTYRYISSLQSTDQNLEDPQWTKLYWQKYLVSDDIREKMAALEWIHRAHLPLIQNNQSSVYLSLFDLQNEITQVFKQNEVHRDVLLMALIECSRILSVSDQMIFHRSLIDFYNLVDVSSLSAQSLRSLSTKNMNENDSKELQKTVSDVMKHSNQPAEIIRAADWLRLYHSEQQEQIKKILQQNMNASSSLDTELFLRGLRYFEHCDMILAKEMVVKYELQKSTDVRLQRLAKKITQ